MSKADQAMLTIMSFFGFCVSFGALVTLLGYSDIESNMSKAEEYSLYALTAGGTAVFGLITTLSFFDEEN